MNLEGRIKLEIAYATDWTDVTNPILGPQILGYQPTSWVWTDVTEGLLSIDIDRGISDYEGPWSQVEPGQLRVQSRNSELDPNVNPNLAAFGHKIRVWADNALIFNGKIRDVTVNYFNEWDPQIITIDAFDALQFLVDYTYENTESAIGYGETEPHNNIVPINLGSIWAKMNMGPLFVYNSGTTEWTGWTSNINRGYTDNDWDVREPLQAITGYWSSIPDPYSSAFSTWNFTVMLDPWNFQGWGNTVINNIPHREDEASGGGGTMAMTVPISWTDPFGDVPIPGGPGTWDYGQPWSIANYNLIDWARYGLGDDDHPAYTNAGVNPSTVTVPPYPAGTFSYNTTLSRSKANGGFVACVSDTENNLLQTLLKMEQSEQGFMYVDASDNIFILNRRVAQWVERQKFLRFSSDGTGTSYDNLEMRDGIGNIVNKVRINNPFYSYNTETLVDEYQNKDYKRFDDGTSIKDIVITGTSTNAYEGILPSREVDLLSTLTLEYSDDESIKRYGERLVELNTNYAWGIEETHDGNQVWTYYQGGYYPQDPSGTPWLPDTGQIRSQENASNEEEMEIRVYDANRQNVMGQFYTRTYQKNVYARAEELAQGILDIYALPRREAKSISWEVTEDSFEGASKTDIFDEIEINHDANGINIVNKTYRVMGINHSITPNSWEISYQLWNKAGFP